MSIMEGIITKIQLFLGTPKKVIFPFNYKFSR